MKRLIATKFVRHDIPPLETLKNARVYRLREKLNNQRLLNREEKNWLAQAVNHNAYFKNAVPLMGYRFCFADVLKKFLVKQYSSMWYEFYAPDKTSLRNMLHGKIEQIVQVALK